MDNRYILFCPLATTKIFPKKGFVGSQIFNRELIISVGQIVCLDIRFHFSSTVATSRPVSSTRGGA